MKNSRIETLLAAVIGVLAFIIISGNIVEPVYADDETSGSTIAGVRVKGLDLDEIQAALEAAILEWSSQPIHLSGGGTQLEIDPTLLAIDMDATIAQYNTLTDKPWYAVWQSKRVVHVPLVIAPNEEVKEQMTEISIWDADATYDTLISVASYLKGHEVEATVLDLSQFESERLAFTIKTIPEQTQGISDIVGSLNNTIINPGQPFSLLVTLGETANVANSETLSFVGSMIYSAVLETEFDIVERTQQSTIPTYVEPGYEASVNLATNEDVQFVNNSEHVAKMKLAIEGNSLKVELYSDVKEVSVSHRVVKDAINPKIVNRYSNDLPAGKQQIIQEGTKGLRVEVYRTISETGNSTEQKVSRDYYPPTNRIVVVSSRKPAEGTTGDQNNHTTPTQDKDLQIDLDGDGLPDTKVEKQVDDKDLPKGSYYDKAGNIMTP